VKLVRDILYRYWQHHDTLIEYFLIDYSFLYARERYPQFREMMNVQPVTGNNRFLIRQFISAAPDAAAIDTLNRDPVGIYKLSHKEQYRTVDNGSRRLQPDPRRYLPSVMTKKPPSQVAFSYQDFLPHPCHCCWTYFTSVLSLMLSPITEKKRVA
jgi:hypothetical protein